MTGYTLAFVAMGLNPFGGLFVAIPLAMFKLHYPVWLATLLTVALAYVQVLVVDFGYSRLAAWPRFVSFVEAKRSRKLEAHLASPSGGLWIALLSPWLGPWLVMAVARFSGVGLKRVGLPLLAGVFYVGVLTAALCLYAPDMLPAEARAYLE